MVDKKLQIKKINIENLIPADYNPRKISEHDYNKLQNSINEFGIVDPIIVNLKDNTIIGGHQRFDVLYYDNKITDLYLLPLGDIGWVFTDTDLKLKDKNHEKALNLALNRIHGEWDLDKLDNVLGELEEINLDSLTGFDMKLEEVSYDFVPISYDDEEDEDNTDDELTDDELIINDESDEIMDVLDNDEKEHNIEENDEKPRIRKGFVKYGDIYKINNSYIMCGDVNDERDRTTLLNNETKQINLESINGLEKIDSLNKHDSYYITINPKIIEDLVIKYKGNAKKVL